MNFSNSFKLLLLATLTLSAVACSGKRNKSTEMEHDLPINEFVEQQLGKAIEQAHSELATLSELRGKGVNVLIPPPDPKLGQKLDSQWTGSATDIIKSICLNVGYGFRQIGTTAQEIPVVVHAKSTSAYEILEDIALQIQPKAYLKVDTISQIITLAYPSN